MATQETLEEKISRLETEKTALLSEKNTLSGSFKEVQTSLKTLTNENETYKTSLSDLTKKYEGLVNESTLEIQRLSEELDSAKTDNSNSIVTTKIGGKKYQIIGKKFNIKGRGEMTIEDIQKDKTLLSDLLNKGAGFLVPVE